MEAYELYLKALQGTAWTNASIENSIAYLKRSIQLDPGYAPSHAALAGQYVVIAVWGLGAPAAMFAMARAEAMKAIELNPNSSGAHWTYALDLAIAGRLEESIKEAFRAHELDPISSESERDLAWLLFLAQRDDESIAHFNEALGMDSNRPLELALLAAAYARKGMDSDAETCSIKARELVAAGNEQMLGTYLADPFCRTGNRAEAMKWIETWERRSSQGHVESFLMAVMIAPTGDRHRAFAWLEKAFVERSVKMPFLKVHPHLEVLHTDPKFLDLVRRVGFPDR